jgi:hypothetical protein
LKIFLALPKPFLLFICKTCNIRRSPIVNLWPFSKKNDSNPSHQFGDPPSGKMELPPGVILVAPEQAGLPSPQAEAEKIMAPLASETTEKEEQDTHRTLNTIAPPSFEDLAHIPATENAELSVIKVESNEKQGSAGFFEETQHKIVTQETLTASNELLSPLNQNDQKEIENVQPDMQDWLSGLTPTAVNPALPKANSEFLTESSTPPKPESALHEQDLSLLFTRNHIPNENPASENASLNFYTDLNPAVSEPVSSLQQANSPNETFNNETPTLSAETLSPEDLWTETNPASPNAEFDDSFLLPADDEETPLQAQGSFEMACETSATKALDLSAFQHTGSQTAPEDKESHSLDDKTGKALPGEAQTDWPQPLNLTDEALTPNGSDSFLTEAGLLDLQETAYLDNKLDDDDTFDLDSILLGNIPAEALPPETFPESQTDPFLNEISEQSTINPELTVSPNIHFEGEHPETEHYFGDEAQGLKNSDNFESYDFGHYEDPDQPQEAFVLDTPPESLCETISFEDNYTVSDNELRLDEIQWNEIPEPTEQQSGDFNDPMTLSFHSETNENKPNEILKPEAETPAPHLYAPQEQEARSQDRSPEICGQSPSAQANQPPPAPPPKPLLQKKLKHFHKSRMESSGHRVESFELEMLHKNSQFLSRSIDHLVNAYFNQENPEAS